MGDEVLTMVTDVSGEGKVRLSRRAVLEEWSLEEALANDRPGGGSGSSRGGSRGGRGGDRGRGGNRGGRGDRR